MKGIAHIAAFKRTTDERAGIHRIDGRAQDCGEIVSKW